MLLTINLVADPYALARSHVIASKTSISKAVTNLLRRKTSVLPAACDDSAADFSIQPVTLPPSGQLWPFSLRSDLP